MIFAVVVRGKDSHYSDNKGTGKIPCSLFSTEKSSLDLISFDRTSWALSYANTAARAELRINMRQIIRNRNGTRRTSLFTLFAANTAIPADFSGLRPFVMTGAADIDFAGCRNNIDQMIGTFPRAHTTAYALTLIYYGNAIHNMNRIIFTSQYAVAKPQAGMRTTPPPLIKRVTGRTGLYAFIVHNVIRSVAVTATFHNCKLLFYICHFHSQNGTDRCTYLVTAGDT